MLQNWNIKVNPNAVGMAVARTYGFELDFRETLFLSQLHDFSFLFLTDTGEDSKLVNRRQRSKVNAAPPFSSLFIDASERRVWLSAESKILAFTFERFRLYRLNSVWHQFLKSKFVKENSLRPKKFLFEMTIFHDRSQ